MGIKGKGEKTVITWEIVRKKDYGQPSRHQWKEKNKQYLQGSDRLLWPATAMSMVCSPILFPVPYIRNGFPLHFLS